LLLAALSAPFATLERPGAELKRDLERADQAIEHWDVEQAAAIADRLVARAPTAGEPYFLRARIRFLEGRYGEVLADLESVLRAAPGGELQAQARDFLGFVQPLAELEKRFRVEESAHFRVHFVDGPDRVMVRRALDVLERSYRAMAEDFGLRPEAKVRVEIFPDPESFEKASTLTKLEIETSGTIALCKFNRLMMLTPRAVLRGFPWCDTLCHEYVHYVLWKRNGGTVPIWLHEGIAKYEEVRWERPTGSELSPLMKQVLKGAIDSGKFVTFEEMHPSFAKLKNPHDVALASAEVLSILRTIMGRGGYRLLGRMLDALREGADGRRMFEKALDQSFDSFWASWQEAAAAELEGVRGVAPPSERMVEIRDPMSPGAPGGGAAGAEPRAGGSGDEEEASGRLARLGDLLRARGHLQAAAVEYEKAAATEAGRSPVLLNRLGLTLKQAGDLEGAVRAFRRSLELDPEYAPTLTDLGLARRARGEAAEAVDALERAVRINPFDPRIHEGLADLYGALGRPAERAAALGELELLNRR
jgi:tetratricopeptide (TPR) repeat protein